MTELEKPMLVIDTGTDLFGEPWYQPRLLVTEMHPVRVARTLGTFKTRREANVIGKAALRNLEQ